MTSDEDVAIDVLLNIASSEASLAFFKHQHDLREQRVLECMTAAGLDYVIEPFPGDPFGGLSRVELARRWGFGYWISLDLGGHLYAEPARSASPNDELLATLDLLERAVWLATRERCVHDAVQGTVMLDHPEIQRALDQFNNDVHEHRIVVAARETWRNCMAVAGYGDFADWQTAADHYWNNPDMDDRYRDLYDSQAWQPTSPDHDQWRRLVAAEIDLAVAEATCTEALLAAMKRARRQLKPAFRRRWHQLSATSLGPRALRPRR